MPKVVFLLLFLLIMSYLGKVSQLINSSHLHFVHFISFLAKIWSIKIDSCSTKIWAHIYFTNKNSYRSYWMYFRIPLFKTSTYFLFSRSENLKWVLVRFKKLALRKLRPKGWIWTISIIWVQYQTNVLTLLI